MNTHESSTAGTSALTSQRSVTNLSYAVGGSDRPRSTASGPVDRVEGLTVNVDPNTLSNKPYSESNWVSTQQLPAMPLTQTSSVGNMMPSPLIEAAQSKVAEERIVTETAGDKVYRESATVEPRDGVSTHTGYWTSTQGATYTTSAQTGGYMSGGAYSSSSGGQGGVYSSSGHGGAGYVSTTTYPSQTAVAQVTSQGYEIHPNLQESSVSSTSILKPSASQEWQITKQQIGTLEVSPLPTSTNIVTTTTSSTIHPVTDSTLLTRDDGAAAMMYREELQQSGRRETETMYTSADVRHLSGVGESRQTDGSYLQSFATMRDNAFHSSGWATTAVDSRIASRMSSTVMSTVTYPPHPDQTVICWPPRVVQTTQGGFVKNADVERWKSSTANTQAENVQIIEVEVFQEKIIEKPRIEYVEKIHKVPKQVIHWNEKIVEKKETVWNEVQKPIDEIVWTTREVPKKIPQDKYVEVIREVKKVIPRIKEEIKEVPFIVERPVPVPTPYDLKTLKVHDVEKATVVAQILKSTLRETEEVAEVNLKEFVPELVPVVIQIPKPVSIPVWLGGIISTIHRRTNVTAAHWNSLVRIANAHVTYTEILPYMRDINTGFIPFLPATERIDWVEPISQEWRQSGWSHVVVPDGYVIKSLEIVVTEINEARVAEFREAKMKLAMTTTTSSSTSVIQTTSAGAELRSPPIMQTTSEYTQVQSARGSTSGLLAGAVTGPALNTSSTSGFNYSFLGPTGGTLNPSFQSGLGGGFSDADFQSSMNSFSQSINKTATFPAFSSSTQQQQPTSAGRSLGKLAGASSKSSILLSDLPVTRDSNTLPGTFVTGEL